MIQKSKGKISPKRRRQRILNLLPKIYTDMNNNMKLTGKCLKEFEKWYSQSKNRLQYKTKEFSGDGLGFTDLPESMQYGVYVDYFDSVGIEIACTYFNSNKSFSCFLANEKKGFNASTRHEARTKAIEKANELRNEQL